MKPPANVEIFETPLLTGWLEGGIFYASSKYGERTIEKYKLLFELYEKLSKNGTEKICTIQDITQTEILSNEVGQFIYEKHPKYIKAMALISDSVLGKTTGDFFIRLKPMGFPMQMFTDLDEAVTWMQQYL